MERTQEITREITKESRPQILPLLRRWGENAAVPHPRHQAPPPPPPPPPSSPLPFPSAPSAPSAPIPTPRSARLPQPPHIRGGEKVQNRLAAALAGEEVRTFEPDLTGEAVACLRLVEPRSEPLVGVCCARTRLLAWFPESAVSVFLSGNLGIYPRLCFLLLDLCDRAPVTLGVAAFAPGSRRTAQVGDVPSNERLARPLPSPPIHQPSRSLYPLVRRMPAKFDRNSWSSPTDGRDVLLPQGHTSGPGQARLSPSFGLLGHLYRCWYARGREARRQRFPLLWQWLHTQHRRLPVGIPCAPCDPSTAVPFSRWPHSRLRLSPFGNSATMAQLACTTGDGDG